MLPFFSSSTSRQAFSLLELLVVIMIISIVYFLGFNGIEKEENRPKALTALNLKNTIEHSTFFKGEGTLLCVNHCNNCYFQDNITSPFEAYENKIDLRDTKVYILDAQESLTEQESGRYHDEKICLVMHFYKNGSSTQLILENPHGTYFLPAFFGKAQKVSSPEEAKDLWLEYSRLAAGTGDFY
jgi:prepilin-type N-terminal cleavage/methylation domain-containing protein